jgi:hypothetical protein
MSSFILRSGCIGLGEGGTDCLRALKSANHFIYPCGSVPYSQCTSMKFLSSVYISLTLFQPQILYIVDITNLLKTLKRTRHFVEIHIRQFHGSRSKDVRIILLNVDLLAGTIRRTAVSLAPNTRSSLPTGLLGLEMIHVRLTRKVHIHSPTPPRQKPS